MKDSYSTKEASTLTGASTPAIRTYTTHYSRYFSTDATPEPGASRRFTIHDLKLIAFVYQKGEREGWTREKVQASLAAGELDHFDWKASQTEQEPQSAAESASSALVPIERLQAARALLEDAQRRESQALEQLNTMQADVQRLSLELGKAQGELAAIKATDTTAQMQVLHERLAELERELGKAQGEAATVKANRRQAPKWWRAVFGGREGE